MILTIYFIVLLLCPIIIMIICRVFPKFVKDNTQIDDDDNIPILTLFCLIWPVILVIALVVGFYFGCYWLINIGNHKE